ncbi:MAG: SWIM zinc finger family protein [Thermoplasmataceae archaeon]
MCTCPDFENRKAACKHIIAVELTKYKIEDSNGNIVVAETKRVTYSQNWTSYNIAQNEEIKQFDQLLSDLVSDVEDTPQTRGRPRLSIKDELFSQFRKSIPNFQAEDPRPCLSSLNPRIRFRISLTSMFLPRFLTGKK